MRVLKGFKYRLDPTPKQASLLRQHGGNARFVWNRLLDQTMSHYEETGKFLFAYDLITSLPALKTEFPFLQESFSQSLQQVAINLDRALTSCFQKVMRFPRFKSKHLLRDSFSCPQKWKLSKGTISLPKIGQVRWIKHRPLQGRPRSVTVTQDGDQWYASVLCEIEVKEQTNTNLEVGIDVGLNNFAVLSTGEFIPNPKNLRKAEERLKKRQREVSRKQKRSKNRLKARLRLAKAHRHVRNQRKDFLHKVSSSIAKRFGTVYVENLKVKNMVRNHHYAKSISDAGWGMLFQFLDYKLKEKSGSMVDVSAPKTTTTCSGCGATKSMPVELRVYECPSCGMVKDRDFNSAVNICTLGQRGIHASGQESSTRRTLRRASFLVEGRKRNVG